MKKYLKIGEMHPRDYSVVGITAAFERFVQPRAKEFFGRPFHEIVSVVQDGLYSHGEAVDDRTETPRALLRKVNLKRIDLGKEYEKFKKNIKAYEEFIQTPKVF